MLILTDRELEFLASYNANWRRLYWSELARLLKEGGQNSDALHEAGSIAPQSGPAKALIRSSAGRS